MPRCFEHRMLPTMLMPAIVGLQVNDKKLVGPLKVRLKFREGSAGGAMQE